MHAFSRGDLINQRQPSPLASYMQCFAPSALPATSTQHRNVGNPSGQVLHRAPEISTTQLQPGSSLALQYSLHRSFKTLTVANWPLAMAPSTVSPYIAYIGQSVTKWTRPVVESQASNSHADVVFPSNRRFGWKEGLDPRIGAGRVLSGRPGGIVTLRKWRRAGTGLDVHELHAYRPTLGYPYLGS